MIWGNNILEIYMELWESSFSIDFTVADDTPLGPKRPQECSLGLKSFSLNENFWILDKSSLKYVP